MESDSLKAVRAINSDNFDDTTVGHLVEEIKSLVSFSFLSHVCQFKGRNCNQAAHESGPLVGRRNYKFFA